MNQKVFKSRATLKKYHWEEIQKLTNIVLKSNEFYKNKFSEFGIKSNNDVKKWSDFKKLPFTTKQELFDDQKNNPPLGTNLGRPVKDYFIAKFTSGTGSVGSMGIPFTNEEINRRSDYHHDFVRHIMPPQKNDLMATYMTSGVLLYTTKEFGLAGYRFLPLSEHGKTLNLLWEILDKKVTVLCATITVLLDLIELAKENNINLKKESSLRLIMAGGEPEASFPQISKLIKKEFGIKNYIDSYGSSEVGRIGLECHNENGLHLNEMGSYFEVIDPETGKESNKGELVATALWRYDFPLIRYRTGDYVEIEDKKCSCGSLLLKVKKNTTRRIKEDYLFINSNKYISLDIQKSIRKYVDLSEYVVFIKTDKQGADVITVLLEQDLPINRNKLINLKNYFKKTFKMDIKLFVVPYKYLPRYTWKAKRIIDLRIAKNAFFEKKFKELRKNRSRKFKELIKTAFVVLNENIQYEVANRNINK